MLGTPNQSKDGDARVHLTPDAIRRLSALGITTTIEAGAGAPAGFDDEQYRAAGAAIATNARDVWSADLVAALRAPSLHEIEMMKEGAVLISMLRPLSNHDLVRACTARRITALAYEMVPRITRAQAVDVLSAMSSIAGYKAAILAASHCARMFPMLMTAAGTATPARVFVIGAGVAGLQAIATCRRLGAIVEAFDLRPAVKEEVQSLGARFVQFDVEGGEGSGGYAAAQSESAQQHQREQMKKVISESDVVITTAMVPGKPAPKLIDDDMVKGMRAGSVIVDLAAEAGGNCTLTETGRTISAHGVTIVGETNLAASIPYHASQMLSRILTTLLSWIVKDKAIAINFDDKVIDAMTVVHNGEVRAEGVRGALGLPAGAPRHAEAVT
jgi:NAD(P) transhydrogenase subunit alpha